MRGKLGDPVVIVSGLPRSGTSMMMRMLDAAGLEIVTDHERSADEDNPKGYYEYERVKELDKGGDRSWMLEHRGKVVKIISFLLKDLPPDCFYKVIFMRRDLDEVLASQNKMLERRGDDGGGTDDAKMKRLYIGHLAKIDGWMSEQPNFETIDIHYSDVIARASEAATRLERFLELRGKAPAMAQAVDASLYRNRRGA